MITYKVITIEGGMTQFSTTERKFAQEWYKSNGFDPRTGESLNLYTILRVVTKQQQEEVLHENDSTPL